MVWGWGEEGLRKINFSLNPFQKYSEESLGLDPISSPFSQIKSPYIMGLRAKGKLIGVDGL
jgi:hypothetical protein